MGGVEMLVLDTGVLVEYIVEKAPHRRKVEQLFAGIEAGEVQLYMNPITMSETLYVASRIYEAAGLKDPNEEAIKYLNWVRKRVRLFGIYDETAIRAGELKKELRLALPDCYVLATSEEMGATPLFAKPATEMYPILGRMRELGVRFLEEVIF